MDESFTFVIGSNNTVDVTQTNEQTANPTASGESSSNAIAQTAANAVTLNFGILLPSGQ
ncbi:MAG: hypothetical protein AB7R89_27920 [Dehalococcoidia bacterium]